MNYGADAADQIVRYSLDGVEHTLRISGTVAKNLAIFIAAVMKDQKKTRGRTRMERMLRERKPMKFFSVPKDRLREFAQEAKSKGLLYVIIRDKKHPDLSEIMVFAEDAAKVNRVLDNMQLDYVKAESAQAVFDGTPSRSQKEQGEPAKAADRQAEMGQTVDGKKGSLQQEGTSPVRTQTVEFPEGSVEFEIGENENVFDIGEIGNGNFTKVQEKTNPSETSSHSRNSSSVEANDQKEKRSSVREDLKRSSRSRQRREIGRHSDRKTVRIPEQRKNAERKGKAGNVVWI